MYCGESRDIFRLNENCPGDPCQHSPALWLSEKRSRPRLNRCIGGCSVHLRKEVLEMSDVCHAYIRATFRYILGAIWNPQWGTAPAVGYCGRGNESPLYREPRSVTDSRCCWEELVLSSREVSNWILTSCQPHRVTSGQSNSVTNKRTLQNLSYSLSLSLSLSLSIYIYIHLHIYKPFLKSVHKTNPYTNIKSPELQQPIIIQTAYQLETLPLLCSKFIM